MRRRLLAAALVGLLGVPALAIWVVPTGMPVDRLLSNLAELQKRSPKDAHVAYLIGRVHSYAVAFQHRVVPGYGWPKSEYEAPRIEVLPRAEPFYAALTPETLSDTELKEHVSAGVAAFQRSLELDDASAEAHLGLAYLLEKAAPLAGLLDGDPLVSGAGIGDEARQAAEAALESVAQGKATAPEALAGLDANARLALRQLEPPSASRGLLLVGAARAAGWIDQAESEYLRAFDLAAPVDAALPAQPMSPLNWTSKALRVFASDEAGEAILRLMGARPAREGDDAVKKRVDEHLAKLTKVPSPNGVTPVVFALDATRSLDELLSPQLVVSFDLDGFGARRWPWLRPETALLVWDPEHAGRIDSGLQLFGSVTWWLFFENGYQAMDLLDDNRDGWLRGDELAGLAIWRDANGNGVSDDGEVVPVEHAGIEALATHATGVDGRSPMNATGLRMSDGRTLPTWDWVTAPVADP